MSGMEAPVGAGLRTELQVTEALINKYANARMDDKTHYVEVVRQLDALAVQVMGNRPTSLLARTSAGARIDMDPETALAAKVSEVSAYLVHHASDLLNNPHNLRTSANSNVAAALGLLKALYRLTLANIRQGAQYDLTKLSDKGSKYLLDAADTLAKQVAGGSVQDRATDEPKPAATSFPEALSHLVQDARR